MLTNLIENAHKYGATPIRVAVQVADDQVVLSVIDHGPGIPPEERETRLRALLPRADPNGTKPGMGLGLSIVRGLSSPAAARCGSRTRPGGGAAFRVVTARAKRCSEQRRRSRMSERPKVLIVDDEPDVLLTLRMILEAEGFRPARSPPTARPRCAASTRSVPTSSCSTS